MASRRPIADYKSKAQKYDGARCTFVPPDVYERARAEAKANGRPIKREIAGLLDEGLRRRGR